jgi:hypothetical protein
MIEYKTYLCAIDAGLQGILWHSDEILIVQVFSGAAMLGHCWSLLISDRTRGPGRYATVYFDLLLRCFGNTALLLLKEKLEQSMIINESWTWVTARVLPK